MFCAGQFLQLPASVVILDPLDADGAHARDASLLVREELLGHDRVVTRVGAELVLSNRGRHGVNDRGRGGSTATAVAEHPNSIQSTDDESGIGSEQQRLDTVLEEVTATVHA